MFGYEHRELLREMQFPITLKDQLQQRFRGALIIPMTLLIIISGAEMILFWGHKNLLSILLGNVLIFEIFVTLFLWSTFNRIKRVKWVSFSFSQPVISQPVAILTSILMIALSATFYISFGTYEIYKQATMLLTIFGLTFWIYHYIDNIQERFISKIIPELWIQL